MSATPTVPDTLDSDRINVLEKTIRQVDCPNPDCDASLDITDVNIGTKIKCKSCDNVTWLPDYGSKWWQKPWTIILGLLGSFVIGVLSSLTASWIDSPDEPSIEPNKEAHANPLPDSSPDGERQNPP